MNLKFKPTLAITFLISSVSANAADPTSNFTVDVNVAAVSDYRFRSIEQSSGGPSIQGGVDFSHKNGVYLGAWAASNVKWVKEFNGASSGDYEFDLYAGYKFEALGLNIDVGAISYLYPGNDSGGFNTLGGATNYSKADSTEGYIGVSYGITTLKYNHSFGDSFGNKDTNGSRYWDLSANFDLGNGFTLTPHLGVQSLPTNSTSNAANTANYTDYALTLSKRFDNGLSASIAAIGSDAKRSFYTNTFTNNGRFLAKESIIVGLKYNF